jgi:hypothetical protein
MWNLNLSEDESRKTLRGLIELELWYASVKKDEKGYSFREAVNKLTELYFFSSLYDKDVPADKNSKWNEFLTNLSGEDAGRDADIAMSDLSIGIPAKMEKAKAEISSSFNGFLYEFRPEYFKPADSPDCLTLHFRNYFAPESPASHTHELAEGLRQIVERASVERPDVKTVQCATWLNNIPFFTGLFPAEWAEQGKPCPYEPSTGWWGQFIDREGKIHAENAEFLRKHRDFKYKNTHCLCGINNLYKHLQKVLSGETEAARD